MLELTTINTTELTNKKTWNTVKHNQKGGGHRQQSAVEDCRCYCNYC